VFRAFDPDHDRLVAVKLFRFDLPPGRVHQFVAELERLIEAGPTHPAAVAPVAAGIEGVAAYLAQDYIAADPLDRTFRHEPASVADSLRVAAELAGALDAAAAIHIEHGVLHPRDVLWSADEVRLTGLGIARAVERMGAPVQVRRPYTAPERAIGSNWDRRADVFSLAAMVHELLWGRRIAGTGRETVGLLTEIAGGDLPQLRAVFERALADDPSGRFDTALEFAGALQEAFSVRSVRLPRPEQERRQPDRNQKVRLTTSAEAMAVKPSLPLRPGKADTTYEPRLPLESQSPALDLFAPESTRFAEVEAVDPPAIPVIGGAEMPPLLPREVMESYHPSGDERSRSAISPLAFAVLIGAAVGFAAGFGVGARDRSLGSGGTASSDAAVASNTNPKGPEAPGSTTGPAREFTEGTVATEAATTASQPLDVEDGREDRRNPRRPAAPPPIVGSLLVRSTPLGARVLVDGREYGRTPVTVGNLSRGAHKVRVIRDGYEPDERQVTVTSAQRAHSMTVRLSPQPPAAIASAARRPAAPSVAPLTVESRPAGATVFLDGQPVGTTPLVLPDVAVGEHAIHLDRDGYQRWSSTIRIVTTERNRVAASLDR
jgi:hypothetical protein